MPCRDMWRGCAECHQRELMAGGVLALPWAVGRYAPVMGRYTPVLPPVWVVRAPGFTPGAEACNRELEQRETVTGSVLAVPSARVGSSCSVQ